MAVDVAAASKESAELQAVETTDEPGAWSVHAGGDVDDIGIDHFVM